jgi:hypothetical protein
MISSNTYTDRAASKAGTSITISGTDRGGDRHHDVPAVSMLEYVAADVKRCPPGSVGMACEQATATSHEHNISRYAPVRAHWSKNDEEEDGDGIRPVPERTHAFMAM